MNYRSPIEKEEQTKKILPLNCRVKNVNVNNSILSYSQYARTIFIAKDMVWWVKRDCYSQDLIPPILMLGHVSRTLQEAKTSSTVKT